MWEDGVNIITVLVFEQFSNSCKRRDMGLTNCHIQVLHFADLEKMTKFIQIVVKFS